MKKLLLTVLIISHTTFLFAQDRLEKLAKISIGIQGLEANYALPISNKIILENSIGIGVGMNAIKNRSEFNLNIPHASPFISSGVLWMYRSEEHTSELQS